MDIAETRSCLRHFGPFEVDLDACELKKCGHRIRVQERPFTILAVLLERPGQLVTREDLRARLWPDGTIVDFENGINAAMGKLRQALRDSAEKPLYVETVPRKGYRFIGKLEEQFAIAPAVAPVRRRPSWLMITSAVFVTLSVFYVWFGPRKAAAPAHHKSMLVVLPFQDYGQNSDQQYLADGLTEEMTTQLSQLDPANLEIIARTTAMQYARANKSVAAIRRELGADYVLEGSLRRSDSRVRVTAQLIRTVDQTHLMSTQYDSGLGDVLTMEAEICRNIANRISITLSPQTLARLGNARPVNPAAYDAFLRGRFLLWNQNYTNESVERAGSYFRTAIDADPFYAPAHAAMAEYYIVVPQLVHRDLPDLMKHAREYAAKAVELDDSLAQAHMIVGVQALFTREWGVAETELQRALELDPLLVRAHAFRSVYLLAVGRPEDAVAEIRRAQQIDPLSQILKGHVMRPSTLPGVTTRSLKSGARRRR